MNRRGFITGLAGCLASAAAPAIVHNPMRIVVPRLKVVALEPFGFDFGFYDGLVWAEYRIHEARALAVPPLAINSIEMSYLDPFRYGVGAIKIGRLPDGMPSFERVDPADLYLCK